MSGNHNQSFEELLKSLKHCGSGACIKTSNLYKRYYDNQSFKMNLGLFGLMERGVYMIYMMKLISVEWHEEIFKYSKKLGMIPFSTPFDHTAVEFFEKLNVECYKIASFENADIPLIEAVCSTGKPVIISTGMMDLNEMDETVSCKEC